MSRGHEGRLGFRSASSAARPPSLDTLHGSAIPVQFNRLSASAGILPGSLRFRGLPLLQLKTQSPLHIGRNKGLPTHPPEPAYPCCLPALGEFCEVTPHEEPRPSLRHNRHPRQREGSSAATDCAKATNRADRAMRRRDSRPHIDAVPDVRASTGFQRSSQTPMRQPEIDNEPIPQCGTRYNARRRAVRSRSRR